MWTKILYEDFTVKVQNNGYFSTAIEVKKGVHQGGCYSSVYFLIIAEILALSLRENEDIDGITYRNIRNLLNQFADDMDIFSLCNQKSIQAMYKELETFRLQSGFTVSYEKTTLYRIGSLRHSKAQMYELDQFKWTNEDINVLGVTIAHEEIIEKNYDQLLEKTKQVLQAWYNRDLTLMGKVQVINTLVASLFVYKMMVLPMMPKQTIKNIENEIRNYIWKGRKSKIALKVLQLPKQEGGLNLVSLHNKDISLKATWPIILHQEQEYASLVYTIMRCSQIGQDIWRCSLQPADVKALKISSTFWEDVLKCWCQYNYYGEIREENQIIWYNSKIKVKGRPIMWADVYNKGLKFVHQLFELGSFKSEQVVMQDYGLTVLRYNSLKVALPQQWKAFFLKRLPQTYLPLPPHKIDTMFNSKQGTSRTIYRQLSGDVIELHSKFIRWRDDVSENIFDTLSDYREAYQEIYRVTNVPKYRSFQYRLLQRALVTNIQLEKWNILPSNQCTFCGKELETVIHVLWYCPEVRPIWTRLKEYLESRFNIVITYWSLQAMILNKFVTPKYHAINFICLVAKQFIYSQKCLRKMPHFNELQRLIKSIENVEKYIATKNQKIQMHVRKWSLTSQRAQDDVQEYVTQYLQTL